MLWLLGEIWVWCVLSFLLGAGVTGIVFVGPAKRRMAEALTESHNRPRPPSSRTQPHRSQGAAIYRSQQPSTRDSRGTTRPPEARTAIRYPQRDYDE